MFLTGSIQQIDGDFVKKGFIQDGNGDVWNFLILHDGVAESKWFVDVFNQSFVELSSDKQLSKLTVNGVKNGAIKTKLLKTKDFEYKYVKITRNKFDINNRVLRNIYSCKNKAGIVAEKYMLTNSVT